MHFFQKQDGRQKTKWLSKLKIITTHLVVVHFDLPQQKNKITAKNQNGRQNRKLIISHSILKLGHPDFIS